MVRMKLSAPGRGRDLESGAIIAGPYQDRSKWDRPLGTLPGTEVTWHRDLSFRTGLHESQFPNDLEVMLQVDCPH